MTVIRKPSTTRSGHKRSNPQEKPAGSPLASALGAIAQISGVITVVAGTVYVLGMVTLLLPIYHTYGTSLPTAWYMVSLVPRIVVAGHGARSLIWPSLGTVLPIAFIVVMILMLVRLLWLGVSHEARRANASGGDLVRGVLFMTFVYGVYSALLGGVLLITGALLEGTESAFFDFHVLAASLAYGVFALWCVLTLTLLTWRATMHTRRLLRSKSPSYEVFRSFGNRKVAMHLALYLGIASVVISGLGLLTFFLSTEGEKWQLGPLIDVWRAVVVALLTLVPMVLLVLLVDKALPSQMLDEVGPVLRALGTVSKMSLTLPVIGASLILISYLWLKRIDVWFRGIRADDLEDLPVVAKVLHNLLFTLVDGPLYVLGILSWPLLSAGIAILFAIPLLVWGCLLLWAVGGVMPPVLLGRSRGTMMVLLTTAISCNILLFSVGLMTFLSAPGGFSLATSAGRAIGVSLLLFTILSLILVLYVVLRRSLRVVELIRRRTLASAWFVPPLVRKVEYFKSWLASESAEVLRYTLSFFVVFYLILGLSFLYGKHVISPLVDNVNSISSSESGRDTAFIWLSIGGGAVSGILIYFKGFGFHAKKDFLSARDWGKFLVGFRRAVLPNSIRKRGFILGLGGAYVLSLVTASLLATLEEPPLPRVVLMQNGHALQSQVDTSTEDAGFQTSTRKLLAHTEGYWYLVDEAEGNLLVVPDRDDRIVHVPEHVEVVDETGALKVEVPAEWDEDISKEPFAWREDPDYRAAYYSRMSKMTISTNVDNWGRGFEEPGIFVDASRAEWIGPVGDYTIDMLLDSEEAAQSGDCGPPNEDRESYVWRDEDHLYDAKTVSWPSCAEGGSYVVGLAAMPRDRSFIVHATIQMPRDYPVDREEEIYRILRSIEVRDDLLP